jgi:polyhydroxyalkanoate synthesis regulator phasin
MPQPKQPGSSASDGPTGDSREARRREDQLRAAAAGLRDILSRGVVLTNGRLQQTVDEAVRRGRLTRQDAEELVQNLVAVGRRQTQDMLAELENLVARSTDQTRRQAHARVQGAGAAARRAPGTDRALRTVDRVRRAAGLGQAFPIIGYDDLTTAQVMQRLGDLNSAQLRKVRDHERRNANRRSVLAAIERKLQ